ncbi:MAG: efflux RND transporter periplasmic adaptor subunit [Pseudomonadota bacterium]
MARTGSLLRSAPILVILLLAGCEEESSDTAAKAPPPPNVVLAKANTETVPVFLELTGRTTAPNTVSIRSRVDGHIESRAFTEGADVKSGDTLFMIDQRPFKTALAQLTGDRDRSQASVAFAAREMDRVQTLVQDGNAPQERLDEKQTTLAEARGDLDSNQGAMDAAQVNLDYTTIKAPVDGRIGRVQRDIGNVVTANESVLVELVQMHPLYVYITPSEAQFLDLEKYRAANPDLKVSITLIDGSTHPHDGELDFSNPEVDPRTGTIAVRAVFPNPDSTLRPGQYAKVKVTLTEQADQITVPAEAINQDQAGFYVYLVDQNNKADLRRVDLGRAYEGRRVVSSGLKEGDTVVVKGQQRVRSGVTVEVKTPSDGTDTTKADG